MVLPLNDTLNRPKRDEYCVLSLQRFVDYRTPSSRKEEETEPQREGNGTKMVLPLNDTLNRPKRHEYCVLSVQKVVDYRNNSSRKNEETQPKRERNGSPKWRKRYEDGAIFKRHAKRIKT